MGRLSGDSAGIGEQRSFWPAISERCPDGQAVCGCDSDALAASVIAEMLGLTWPLEMTRVEEDGFFSQRQPGLHPISGHLVEDGQRCLGDAYAVPPGVYPQGPL